MPEENQELKSKLEIALTLVKRARTNNLAYGWIGADSFYGRDKKFQNELDHLGETFVLDVPNDFRIYTHDTKPYLPSGSKTGRTPIRYKSNIDSLEVKTWVKRQGKKAFRAICFERVHRGQ